MPKKNPDNFTKEEQLEYNIDLFGTIQMINETDKSAIYGLNVIKNKKNSTLFDPSLLNEKDLLQCEQVFNEIYAPAEAFRKKHGEVDVLSDFYAMKQGTRLHVKTKMEALLKHMNIDVSDPRVLDQYCKAYILYGMTTPDEKVAYNPGFFSDSEIYFTPKNVVGLRVLREDGGSQVNVPVMVGMLANLNHKFDKYGNNFQTYVLKDDDKLKTMDVDIFDKYRQGYTFEWPEANKYSKDLVDDDELDFGVFPEDKIEDYELEIPERNQFSEREENKQQSEIEFKIDEEDIRDEKLVDHLQDDDDELQKNIDSINIKKQVKNSNSKNNNINNNIINNINSINIIKDDEEENDINLDDDFDLDDIPDIDADGNRISDFLDDNNKKIRRITDEKTLSDIAFLVRTLKETSADFEFQSAEKYGDEIDRLFDNANNVDVRPEEEIALGANYLAIHFEMKKALDKLYQEKPERFSYDKEAIALREAFKLNTNLLAESLGKNQTAIFEKYISDSYKRITDLAKRPDEARNFENTISDEIAKILYLGKLRHEFSKVHGTPEEVKAWKESILNEVMSDGFEANYKAYKNSDAFKRVMAEYEKEGKINEDALKGYVAEGLLNLASEKYNNVYKYFITGVKNQDEINEVENAARELDELRSIGITAQANVRNPEYGTFNDHMLFDTAFVKKKANLYGKQKDIVNDLIKEKKEQRDFYVTRRKALEKERDKLVREFNEDEEFLKTHADKYKLIDREIHYENKSNEVSKEISKIKTDTQEGIKKIEELSKTLNSFAAGYNDVQDEMDVAKLNLAGEKDFYITQRKKINQRKDNIQNELAKLTEKVYKEEQVKEENRKLNQKVEDAKAQKAIEDEEKEYREALRTNNKPKIERIKDARLRRDRLEKKDNPDLYEARSNYKAKDFVYGSYFSRDYESAKNKMVSVYARYKNAYSIHDPELDKQFEQSIKDNDQIEKSYSKNDTVRPERPELQIKVYDEVVNPDVHIEVVDPLDDIIGYREPANNIVEEPAMYFDPLGSVVAAINSMDALTSFFYGSDEYDRILANLKNLKVRLEGNLTENDTQSIIQDYKKVITEIGQYVDRKNDEKDSRAARGKNEKNRSRNRRQAAENAQSRLEAGLAGFKVIKNVLGRDDLVEEINAEISTVKELTKKNDPELDEVVELLNQGDKYEAINTLLQYLGRNRNKYMNADNSYNFRMNDEEIGKKRIPADKDERVYKTLLKVTEKLINSQMKYYKEHEPKKLPNFRYNMSHLTGSEEIKGKSVSEVFGINIEMPEDELLVVKRNDIWACAREFEDKYKILANKRKYDGVGKKLYDPDHYLATAVLTYQQNEVMIESALSALYLKDRAEKNPNEVFNFEQVDADRRKFITIIKESSFYDTLRHKNAQYMDLRDVPNANVKELANINTKTIYTPEKFNRTIIKNAIKETLSKEIKEAVEYIDSPNYSYEVMRDKFDAMDKNLKIAKALGLEASVKSFYQEADIPQNLKGKDIAETLKNIKEQVKAKNEIRKAEVSKGVKL